MERSQATIVWRQFVPKLCKMFGGTPLSRQFPKIWKFFGVFTSYIVHYSAIVGKYLIDCTSVCSPDGGYTAVEECLRCLRFSCRIDCQLSDPVIKHTSEAKDSSAPRNRQGRRYHGFFAFSKRTHSLWHATWREACA